MVGLGEINCDSDESPLPRMVDRDVRRACRLAKLTLRQREVFWLYAVHGLTITEIARLLGLGTSTASRHFSTACRKIEAVKACGVITALTEVFGGDAPAQPPRWAITIKEYYSDRSKDDDFA